MCNDHHKKTTAPLRISRRGLVAGMSALGVLGFTGLSGRALAAGAPKIELPKPGPRDACPVCGMFPARYPNWVATVLYKDGYADHFDGAKDFFKYLLDMQKYAGGRKRADITGMGVTDYYETALIDARAALYVIGSDVLGPMGHELVPHPDDYDAKGFIKDHKGKAVLTFDKITMAMLLGLDDGKFLVP